MRQMLRLSVMTLFHPITAFQYIKRERDQKFSYLPILLMLLLAVAVKIASLYGTHYPLTLVDLRYANIFLEVSTLLLPVLTWALASYAMTTILDGETLLREALLAMAYALTPYILFTLPLTALSHVLEIEQATFYHGMEYALLGWVILLTIVQLKEMNNYSGKKTLLVVLLSVFTMALLWATVALIFTIVSQFIGMIVEMVTEVRYAIS
jgi:hypothetical protein